MVALRSLSISLVFCIHASCGDQGRPTEGLDLVGKPSGSTPTGTSTKGFRASAAPKADSGVTVDLIEDLVFRNQRDGWTLTTPEAHVNIEKLRAGGVDLVLSALPLTPGMPPRKALDKGLKALEGLIADAGGQIEMASDYASARAANRNGHIAMMLMLEGSDVFSTAPELLTDLKRKGLVMVGLVAGRSNAFADAAVAPRDPGGLTAAGEQFLQACRDAGIVVDLTHASPNTFYDTLVAQSGAVVVSHTAARALMDHPRNLDDIQIIALARYGGLMGLLFNPEFLTILGKATIDDVVAHIMHIKAIGAIQSLALGTDYGGIRPPEGLGDISMLPRLREALGRQGLSDQEITGIFGENAVRFFEESTRQFGAIKHTADQIYRPILVECDVIIGESEGLPALACNGCLTDGGAVIQPASRHRIRLTQMALQPVELQIFGDPDVPWQVEGQNLQGKILFHRFVQLDANGIGIMSLPSDQNLTRMFFTPTRASALKEVVIWGRKPDAEDR